MLAFCLDCSAFPPFFRSFVLTGAVVKVNRKKYHFQNCIEHTISVSQISSCFDFVFCVLVLADSFCLWIYLYILYDFFASALHDRLYMTGMLYEILSILSRRLRVWSQADISIHNMCRVLTNWYPIMVLEN
jgi:hypothetical protein